jgi:hypothetical protein
MYSRYLIAIALILYVRLLPAQDNAELERRNGFKDLKLGMAADSVLGIKFKKEIKERGEFPASLFVVENPDYAKIGEINVNSIELRAYKGMVYQINIVTDKDTRLMKALESIYGRPEYDLKGETYFWKSTTLILKFKSFSKKELEMIYSSYLIFDKMKEDKEKKVQDIADDF